MDKPFWVKYRKEQLTNVDRGILEIGIGTGLNLPHDPAHVRRIATVGPNPGMDKWPRRRIDQSAIEADRRTFGSEQIPFAENVFDWVVSTVTLCSISKVEQAWLNCFWY